MRINLNFFISLDEIRQQLEKIKANEDLLSDVLEEYLKQEKY